MKKQKIVEASSIVTEHKNNLIRFVPRAGGHIFTKNPYWKICNYESFIALLMCDLWVWTGDEKFYHNY